MSALEWLVAVRADLDEATPGPWDAARPDFRFPAHVITGGPSNTDLVATNVPERDARIIASAPDRLDRMERALRAVLDLAVAVNAAAIIPTSEPIMNAGYRIALGDIVTAIKEALGDE